MPYVQLDLPVAVPPEERAGLAAAVGNTYAETMQTETERVSVAFRELGEDGVLRCMPGGPRPVVVVHADIRRGRPAEQRESLARALTALLTIRLGVEDVVLYVTEHDPTEIYRDGSFTTDWEPPAQG
jgi:phenylpyruvate tautomerase PptA (4-oxalocrotonate tautomerase family)